MPRVYRQQYTRPIPQGAERVTLTVKKKGVEVQIPAVRFKGSDGKTVTAPIVQKGKTAGTHCRVVSPTWYGRVNGQPVPLCSNKAASEVMLAEKIKEACQGAAGMRSRFEEQRKRLLNEHLADFRRHLEGKGNDPRYVELVRGRLQAVFAGCGFRSLADLDAGKAADWLAAQRNLDVDRPTDPGEPDLPPLAARGLRPALPGGYSRDRLAELLGVKPFSVPPAVARHGLAAIGKGRNRRFPRETVQALLALGKSGASVATTNQYVMHLKVFGNWLVRPGRRLGANPFLDLEAGNEATDRRHDRQDLTATELRLLLETTRASKRTFRGLDGEARFVLYATACGTGFRAGGLAGLTPECFDLDGDFPTVTLPVRSDKSRKGKIQPLPADVAELLRAWLAGKPAGVPVWPGKWASQRAAALMLRKDLKAAGVPFVVQGPNGPLYADFHALRHTYLTLGGRAGIDLRTLQELAGHSTADLTERYTHVRLHDLAGAVEKLPAILPPEQEKEAVHLQATGTGGPIPDATGAKIPYTLLTDEGDGERGREAESEGGNPQTPPASVIRNPLSGKEAEGDGGRSMGLEGRAGDGIRTHDVQLGKMDSAPTSISVTTYLYRTSVILAGSRRSCKPMRKTAWKYGRCDRCRELCRELSGNRERSGTIPSLAASSGGGVSSSVAQIDGVGAVSLRLRERQHARLAGAGRQVEDLPGALGQQLSLNAVDGVCGLDLLGEGDERTSVGPLRREAVLLLSSPLLPS
jgi:integrase